MHNTLKIFKYIIVSLLFTILLSGCILFKTQPPVKKEASLYEVPFSEYPEFADDMAYDSLAYGINQSISYLNRVSSSKEFKFGNDIFDAAHMIQSLEMFLSFIKTKPTYAEMKKYIESNYRVYRSVGSNKSRQVLFTGYYEPTLQGSLQKSEIYRYPIYARPSDLCVIDLSLFSYKFKGKRIIGRYEDPEFVPYYDRKEIETKGLSDDITQPLAWVDNKVDLFFLQIQGSGKVFLDNGQIINVHYHISNGHPYRSIGNYLINKGEISQDEMSMQKIKTYLNQHPEEINTVLDYNPSYVFFKLEKDGPYGCLNVKLTPGRSIALDRGIFPSAGLAFIESKIPVIDGDEKIHEWAGLSRFVLNQDTGGAIKGPGRGDLFWGNGSYAEIAAGHMKHAGSLYFLVLKPEF